MHIESGKSYVGSAINFSIRFKQYLNYNHISRNRYFSKGNSDQNPVLVRNASIELSEYVKSLSKLSVTPPFPSKILKKELNDSQFYE